MDGERQRESESSGTRRGIKLDSGVNVGSCGRYDVSKTW